MPTRLKVLKSGARNSKNSAPKDSGAEIIAVANQKGGVGKTTTTTNLAAALAERGHSVLLVDLDPQSSLSISLGLSVHALKETIYDVLLETRRGITLEDVIQKTKYENIDIAPSNIDLSKAEMELMSEMDRERALSNAFRKARGRYEYILIDCPPSLGLLTTNALAAAQKVIIPTQSDYLAVRGASLLINTIEKVRRKLNPGLEIGGILITMHDNRTIHAKEILEEIRATFGDKVFTSVIGQSVRAKEAPVQGETILSYDPRSPLSESYRSLAMEVVNG